MQVNKWHLTRFVYLLRQKLEEELADVPIDILAEEVGEEVALYFRAEVLGESRSAVVDLDVPAGPWQALKACLGLPHKTRHLYICAYQVFPDLKLPADQKTRVYAEIQDV